MHIPTLAMITFAAAFASNAFTGITDATAQQPTIVGDAPAITAEAINAARLEPADAHPTARRSTFATGEPKVFASITPDEGQAMKDHGLV